LPEQQFILDHCGVPNIKDNELDSWRQYIRAKPVSIKPRRNHSPRRLTRAGKCTEFRSNKIQIRLAAAVHSV
jgi:hypothetical protein